MIDAGTGKPEKAGWDVCFAALPFGLGRLRILLKAKPLVAGAPKITSTAKAGAPLAGEIAELAAAGKFVNCFPSGTVVGTEHGLRPIQDVRASDWVWAFDLLANEWKLRQVIETYQHEHDGDLVAVTVAGEVIESTGHHPWWVVRGESLEERPQPEHVPFNPDGYSGIGQWVDAIDFRAGDVLLLRSGEQAAITELTVRHARLPVYNFQVEELHCYAVGHAQVLVHNNSFDTAYGRYVSKVDGYKHALDPAHVKAALREKGGEIVKLKPDGKTPYDHLLETRNAMNGLFDRIPLLKKYLTDPNLTPAQRAIIQEELSTASKMLDNAERILGELAGSVR